MMPSEDGAEKDQTSITLQEDAMEESRRPRIIFDDEVFYREQRHTRWEHRQNNGRLRSHSISSIRSRIQTISGIPIGFRTLSFQVSHSQEVTHQSTKNDSNRNEDLEYFNSINFHLMPSDTSQQRRQVQGNATDGAVLKFAEAANPGQAVHHSHGKVFRISFNSNSKWMLTIHESNMDEIALDRDSKAV